MDIPQSRTDAASAALRRRWPHARLCDDDSFRDVDGRVCMPVTFAANPGVSLQDVAAVARDISRTNADARLQVMCVNTTQQLALNFLPNPARKTVLARLCDRWGKRVGFLGAILWVGSTLLRVVFACV